MPGYHEELKRALRAARSNAGIKSDQELALRSGVHYEGREIEPPPLQDAIRELVEEMKIDRRERHEAHIAMLQMIQALIAAIPRLTG